MCKEKLFKLVIVEIEKSEIKNNFWNFDLGEKWLNDFLWKMHARETGSGYIPGTIKIFSIKSSAFG